MVGGGKLAAHRESYTSFQMSVPRVESEGALYVLVEVLWIAAPKQLFIQNCTQQKGHLWFK